jgi:hypothetical protein
MMEAMSNTESLTQKPRVSIQPASDGLFHPDIQGTVQAFCDTNSIDIKNVTAIAMIEREIVCADVRVWGVDTIETPQPVWPDKIPTEEFNSVVKSVQRWEALRRLVLEYRRRDLNTQPYVEKPAK